ncbi:MAG: purine-binding chemotaxis protein CheW [Lachnospiraceae bacterium]|jgi:purine-binding chemotaxis protein CheW|nr:purine-binding chemotaxis protein CheW [Lachnospiraceae bacterium]
MDENEILVESKQYIVVKLDAEQYGIDISYIDNIVRMERITRVPKAQSFFPGVINLRGEIIPVMSLRNRFGLADKETTNATRMIILKPENGAKIGILVDEVREVVTLDDNNIEKTSSRDEQGFNLLGIGKYKDTLISLLNIQEIINELDNA